jgi:hypothetical protein
LPTVVAAAGDADVAAKALKEYKAGTKTFNVHLDGYNLIPFFKGQVKESPRKYFLYRNDSREFLGIRVHDWKFVFSEEPSVRMRAPRLYKLRTNPFEQATNSDMSYAKHPYLVAAAQRIAANWLSTLKEFLPRHRSASLNLDITAEEFMRKA